jgi:hypothetical protein
MEACAVIADKPFAATREKVELLITRLSAPEARFLVLRFVGPFA